MDDAQFDRISKAIADGRRFAIFQAIAAVDELSCGAVARKFPVAQATVSHHLKVLSDAGLIDVRREGQHGYFSARPEVLQQYLEELRGRAFPKKRTREKSRL